MMVTVKKVVLSSVLVLLALSGPIQIGFLMSSTTTVSRTTSGVHLTSTTIVSRTKLGVHLNETILDAILKCAPFSVVMEPRSACKQLVNDKIVIASGISSNHFEEVRDMIASVHYFYPSLHIVIYNLGLTNLQINTLESYCNVHVRQFNFSKYPDFVRDLRTYAWKPLMVHELSKEFDFIFYHDASIRLMKPVVDIVLPLLKEFPFVPLSLYRDVAPMNIIRTTHDGMLQYLNITQSREELDVFGVFQSGAWALRVNDLTVSKILEPWADCALHKECIAPEGAQLLCWAVKRNDAKGASRGCHRYDQSALNMILAREFGLSVWDLLPVKEVDGFIKIHRFPTDMYKLAQNCF